MESLSRQNQQLQKISAVTGFLLFPLSKNNTVIKSTHIHYELKQKKTEAKSADQRPVQASLWWRRNN